MSGLHSMRTRTMSTIQGVRTAFGAPGNWGYETPKGKALSDLYDLFNTIAAMALIANAAAEDGDDEPLDKRIAACLADIIDTPVMKLHDPVGNFTTEMDVYLGSFLPELSERAAILLEEAGV